MIRNRSVPADIVLPHITYRNVEDALAWLTRTFGFTEHYRYGEPGGPASGAQMFLGSAYIMLNSARPGCASPAQLGHLTQSLTVFVGDVDAHYERTKAAGANIVEELHETCYGERQYGVEDLEGHHWLFSQHARDVSPDEWGATIARS
ncbi:MAG TPA: VOC family protein [Bryobacteraceae bacterium]|nr:VOC family protein [Bryobacteraceae bacterium]